MEESVSLNGESGDVIPWFRFFRRSIWREMDKTVYYTEDGLYWRGALHTHRWHTYS